MTWRLEIDFTHSPLCTLPITSGHVITGTGQRKSGLSGWSQYCPAPLIVCPPVIRWADTISRTRDGIVTSSLGVWKLLGRNVMVMVLV